MLNCKVEFMVSCGLETSTLLFNSVKILMNDHKNICGICDSQIGTGTVSLTHMFALAKS